MPFRKLFSRKPPATVAELRVDEDADGLLRALKDPSPTVVRDAAMAMSSLYLHGRDASRDKVAAAGPALLEAYARQQTELVNLKSYQVIDKGDRATAQWAIIEALGTIRAFVAEPLLRGLVEDGHADSYLRGRAAAALGRVAGSAGFELLLRSLEAANAPGELVEGAAVGLLAVDNDGEPVVRHAVLEAQRPEARAAVKQALEHQVASGGEYQEPARRILAAIAEEAAWQAGQRKAWEEAVVAKRIEAFPLAARLATLLGRPEWLADRNLIKAPGPTGYDQSVAACRELGLAVDEVESEPEIRVLRNADDFGREETAEERTYHVTATVHFEGEQIAITGGLRVQRIEL